MNLSRRSYSVNQVYHVNRWCLICGQDVKHRFKAPNDTTSNLEWDLIISCNESKWNDDNDPRLDISLKPKWNQGNHKRRVFAEVKFTIDEHRNSEPTAKRYTVQKFNMSRVEEDGYCDILRSGPGGTGMPVKGNLTKVVISMELVYIDGPLEVITINELKPNPELSNKLGALLDSGKLSDVTFEINGEEISAHRAILAAMSDTFSAMFEHDLLEKKTGRVVITDCETDVFKALLRFIYTGNEPTWKNNDFAMQLMMVADKYSLTELRRTCLGQLLRSLNPENAIPTFLAVETLGLQFGEEVVFTFLRENSRLVLASDSWKQFLENNPRKAAEILVKVLSKDNPPAQNFQVQAPVISQDLKKNQKGSRVRSN